MRLSHLIPQQLSSRFRLKKPPRLASRQTCQRLSLNRPPKTADSNRIYAIGDIHGRLDLLNMLLSEIEADILKIPANSPLKTQLIFLGDYIDRGPDSRGVIARLMEPLPGSEPPVFLLGNHEQVLLRMFTTTDAGQGWLHYGGRATLASYGLPCPPGEATPTNVEKVQQTLRQRFPKNHRKFITKMGLFHVNGDYLFTHAGIRMDKPLRAQSIWDLLWSREGFLESQSPREKIIVHGHTISEEVEFLPHRIGVDTGAYVSGNLSAVVLEGESRRVLQTGASETMFHNQMRNPAHVTSG